jgi:hypothetical protein
MGLYTSFGLNTADKVKELDSGGVAGANWSLKDLFNNTDSEDEKAMKMMAFVAGQAAAAAVQAVNGGGSSNSGAGNGSGRGSSGSSGSGNSGGMATPSMPKETLVEINGMSIRNAPRSDKEIGVTEVQISRHKRGSDSKEIRKVREKWCCAGFVLFCSIYTFVVFCSRIYHAVSFLIVLKLMPRHKTSPNT